MKKKNNDEKMIKYNFKRKEWEIKKKYSFLAKQKHNEKFSRFEWWSPPPSQMKICSTCPSPTFYLFSTPPRKF